MCACRLGRNKKWTKPYRGDQIRAYRDIFDYLSPRAFAVLSVRILQPVHMNFCEILLGSRHIILWVRNAEVHIISSP